MTPARAPRRRGRSQPGALRRRVAAGLVACLAVTAAACTDDDPATPAEALVEDVQSTLDQPFAYRLVAEADRDAMEALGTSLGSVAARLNLFEVTGVVDGETATLDLRAFGTDPLVQFRRIADDELYLRVAAGDGPLRSLATPELEGRLLGVAVQTAQPDSVVAAIGALFDGDWVAVDGEFDASALGQAGPSDAPTDDAPEDDATTTPIPELLADYLSVSEQTDTDGATSSRVTLRARALLRSLGSLGDQVDLDAFEEGLAVIPETVTGDVLTRDGVIEAVEFDVAAAAREAGDDVPGSLVLRLELSDHGEPDPPPVPEARVRVPSRDLAEGLGQLLSTPVPRPSTSAPIPDDAPTDGAPTDDAPIEGAT